ncbi:MAG: topoisomerase C-terminal repeat-containing protein [Butyrivibrio sp.]|nr:topoisomerase C-terminal repeat-containing protein [Butyrivibrio sp.]
MKKALLIAEKPSLRRTIEEVYKKNKSKIPYEITFMEQRGHLLTLKNPDEIDESLTKWEWESLPIYPDELGGWKYKVIPEKKTGKFLTAKERFDAIKKELSSGEYDFVINAGDPDQEGQLLVRIVLAALKNTLPIKRYWSNDTTEAKVLDALVNLRDDDSDPMLVNLLEAAYVRQHSDWLFGMNVSRAATLQMRARAACGRVKTPIMAIVCRREDEINNFVPKTCYGVKANYSEDFSGALYEEPTSEEEKDEKDENAGLVWFDTKEEAEDVISSLSNSATVKVFESKKVETYAPKLYKLATAQVDAGKMGYSSAQTLEIIQSLYEKKLMSYPRTDCEYLSSGESLGAMLKSASAVPELVPYISGIDSTTIGKVKHTKKWVNDEKLKESGHSALVPTSMKPDFSTLSPDEQKIYTMIAKRFVAIFLPPLVQNKRLLISDVSGKLFKSTGKTLIDPGFSVIFGSKFTDNEIPMHTVGDSLDIDGYEVTSKTTTCPKRFTDADLIAVCEAPHKFLNDKSLKGLGKKLKIGTPATRANIIEELISKDKYLMRTKEKSTTYIVPTEAGKVIYENLKDCDICKVDLTGEWELKLEDVRAGKATRADVESGMKAHVKRLIDDIRSTPMKSMTSSRSTIGTCPECGGSIISSEKSFYCSNYKEGCHFGAFRNICDSKISDDEFLEMLDGKEIKKMLKKGTTKWEQALKYNLSEHKIEFVQREKKEVEYKCPCCGGKLKDNGRVVSCGGCDFKLWLSVAGKTLTPGQVKSFFENGTTGVIKGLKSKAGNKFDAELVLSPDKSGSTFKFANK